MVTARRKDGDQRRYLLLYDTYINTITASLLCVVVLKMCLFEADDYDVQSDKFVHCIENSVGMYVVRIVSQ